MKTISLTRGLFALVDDGDFERVLKFRWHAQKSGRLTYAKRGVWNGKNNDTVFLHQFIAGTKNIDHRNGNGLDCRRQNLRPANKSQNGMAFQHKREDSTSAYRGVSWDNHRQKWQMHISKRVGGKRVRRWGRFDTETDAARAYDLASKEMFGDFGTTNFL